MSRGNLYILDGYYYDENFIYGTAVKDIKSATLTIAWQHLHSLFANAGVVLKTYILDNETSKELMQALEEKETTYQLVHPYNHCGNLVERIIQT